MPLSPILLTKLQIPVFSVRSLSRPRLIQRLNSGLSMRLTLLSAPAGYGKTTLLTEWIQQAQPNMLKSYRIAWLSLDEYDNDPERFIAYLVTALQQVDPAVGSASLQMASMLDKVPQDDLLISVLNDVSKLPYSLLFVVDDYHHIQDKTTHRQVAFMLDRLPANVHVVLSTREDPPEILARLRARGQVNELRTADLRFTIEEIKAFLSERVQIPLAEDDLKMLENTTEGWIAALQLAVPAIRKGQNPSDFIQGFGGTTPLVMDYLLEEIFNQEDDTIRSFLLRTSILERFSADLCNVLATRKDGLEVLSYLERANVLLEPLDSAHTWYRYHHIFSDFLRSRLEWTFPAEVAVLHRRASKWYSRKGFVNEAIYHALAGKDYRSAVRLMEGIEINPVLQIGSTTVLSWLRLFPERFLSKSPRLLLWYAWSNLIIGNLPQVSEYLARAENVLKEGKKLEYDKKNGTVVPAQQDRMMLGEAEMLRSYLAYYGEDPAGTIEHSQKALKWFGGQHPGMEGHAKGLQGSAYLLQLNYPLAVRAYAEASQICMQSGEAFMAWLLTSINARLEYGMGELMKAEQALNELIEKVPARPPYMLIRGKAYADLGEIARERNELGRSEAYLKKGIEILESESCSLFLGDAYISLLSVYMASRSWHLAENTLQKAKNLTCSLQHHKYNAQVEAYQAWLRLLQGQLHQVSDWAEKNRFILNEDEGFPLEFPQYILVRACLAQPGEGFDPPGMLAACLPDCTALLDRLLAAAMETERLRSVVTISILQAQVYQRLAQTEESSVSIRRALILAEQSGFMRLFLDEGKPVEALLQRAYQDGVVPGYAARVLIAFRNPHTSGRENPPDRREQVNNLLVEPLSPRELDILDLLAASATNNEIAQRCSIELSTVKSHVSSILSKLAVKSRRQAVHRAYELGLIQP